MRREGRGDVNRAYFHRFRLSGVAVLGDSGTSYCFTFVTGYTTCGDAVIAYALPRLTTTIVVANEERLPLPSALYWLPVIAYVVVTEPSEPVFVVVGVTPSTNAMCFFAPETAIRTPFTFGKPP